MSLIDLVLAVHDELSANGTPHAFGGALALAYVAAPRATIDVDVNVFVNPEQVPDIVDRVTRLGVHPERAPEEWMPAAGVRLVGSNNVIDLFPSLDTKMYGEIRRRIVKRPFGPNNRRLPFLSPEDLALFKLSFGRPKDWVDLRAIAAAKPDLDTEYIERQIITLRGATMYPRLVRLRALLAATAG